MGCMVSEITTFHCKPVMTPSWFLRRGRCTYFFDCQFWKGDPNFIFMFNWHFMSILNGLDVIRLFLHGWNFRTGAKFWGFRHPKRQIEKNTCWEGTFLRQTAYFEPLWVTLSLSVWPMQVRKKKGRKAGRKKSHKKCIFHVCVEWLLAGEF